MKTPAGSPLPIPTYLSGTLASGAADVLLVSLYLREKRAGASGAAVARTEQLLSRWFADLEAERLKSIKALVDKAETPGEKQAATLAAAQASREALLVMQWGQIDERAPSSLLLVRLYKAARRSARLLPDQVERLAAVVGPVERALAELEQAKPLPDGGGLADYAAAARTALEAMREHAGFDLSLLEGQQPNSTKGDPDHALRVTLFRAGRIRDGAKWTHRLLAALLCYWRAPGWTCDDDLGDGFGKLLDRTRHAYRLARMALDEEARTWAALSEMARPEVEE